MKKFFMITPLQPRDMEKDNLHKKQYKPMENKRLEFDGETRFPIIPVINAYAQEDEEIQLIAITPTTDTSEYRIKQLNEELRALQEKKKFICDDAIEVQVKYAGDVDTQIEIFHKLLQYIHDGDILYGCLTYGNKPMPIAELMAIQYGYRVLDNVSIGCLVYGEVNRDETGSPAYLFDITKLVQLDEIVRTLANQRVKEPIKAIEYILKLGEK